MNKGKVILCTLQVDPHHVLLFYLSLGKCKLWTEIPALEYVHKHTRTHTHAHTHTHTHTHTQTRLRGNTTQHNTGITRITFLQQAEHGRVETERQHNTGSISSFFSFPGVVRGL